MAGHEAGGKKRLLALALGALVVAVAAAGLRAPSPQPVAAAAPIQQGTNRAGVVVSFGDSVQTRCVTFSEPVISAEDLLRLSGLSFEMDAQGNICSISAVGCPANDCYCQCIMPNCFFWGYFHLINNEWQRSLDIPTWYDVMNGAVEGWSWASGNFTTSAPPPLYTFEQICSASEPTLTPTTSVNTATPSVTPDTPLTMPQVTFQADSALIKAGSCTVLRWLVENASQVMLDGILVNAQDQQEVCPTATRRYVLLASNPAGQTTREIIIQVVPAAVATATATLTVAATLPDAAPTASPAGAGTIVVASPTLSTPLTTPTLSTPLTTPTIAVAPTPTGIVLPPSVTPVVVPAVAPTQSLATTAVVVTATPLLRPIAASASPTAVAGGPDVPPSQRLLPLALGSLLAAGGLFFGFWVLRRKARPETKKSPVQEES